MESLKTQARELREMYQTARQKIHEEYGDMVICEYDDEGHVRAPNQVSANRRSGRGQASGSPQSPQQPPPLIARLEHGGSACDVVPGRSAGAQKEFGPVEEPSGVQPHVLTIRQICRYQRR